MNTIQEVLRNSLAGAGRFDVWTVSGERWLYLTPAHVTDDGAFFTDVDGEQVVMALACIVAVMPR